MNFDHHHAKNKTEGLSALLYCRVSSAAQLAKGDGLRSQETRCREYCGYQGYDVDRVFYDRGISGAYLDRPGIKELIHFLQRSKTPENYVVVFDDVSRLARDFRAHFDLRDAIINTGAQMACPTLEFREDADGRYFEGMQALNAEHHRRKNAEQAKSRMRARMMNGYWCFYAPPGYKFERVAGHGNLLVRNEPLASVYQEALEGFASGRFGSQAEVKRFLEGQPAFLARKKSGKVTYEDIVRLLTRPHYAGYVEKPDWGVALRKGHHEGLITLEAYERIQERLKEGARVPARKDINADFPLRGFVTCGCCDGLLTSCWSKSKTGAKHPYYMCFNKGCESYRKSIRRDAVEGEFDELLRRMRPSERLFNYVRVIFKHEWDKRLEAVSEMKKVLRRDILKIERQIEKLMDQLMDSESDTAIKVYERRIGKLEKDKLLKAEKLANGTKPKRGFDEMFELAFAFLSNPWKLWASEHLEDKRMVLKLGFEDRISYCRNQGFRTPKTTLPFNILDAICAGEKKMADRVSAIIIKIMHYFQIFMIYRRIDTHQKTHQF